MCIEQAKRMLIGKNPEIVSLTGEVGITKMNLIQEVASKKGMELKVFSVIQNDLSVDMFSELFQNKQTMVVIDEIDRNVRSLAYLIEPLIEGKATVVFSSKNPVVMGKKVFGKEHLSIDLDTMDDNWVVQCIKQETPNFV